VNVGGRGGAEGVEGAKHDVSSILAILLLVPEFEFSLGLKLISS